MRFPAESPPECSAPHRQVKPGIWSRDVAVEMMKEHALRIDSRSWAPSGVLIAVKSTSFQFAHPHWDCRVLSSRVQPPSPSLPVPFCNPHYAICIFHFCTTIFFAAGTSLVLESFSAPHPLLLCVFNVPIVLCWSVMSKSHKRNCADGPGAYRTQNNRILRPLKLVRGTGGTTGWWVVCFYAVWGRTREAVHPAVRRDRFFICRRDINFNNRKLVICRLIAGWMKWIQNVVDDSKVLRAIISIANVMDKQSNFNMGYIIFHTALISSDWVGVPNEHTEW